MLTVYGIPNCDTIKKTLDWLKANQIEFQFHDYRKEGISEEKLNDWLAQVPLEKLFNKASTSFKELPDEVKPTVGDPAVAVQLMQEKTSVIKRPVVEKDGKVLAVGFKADEYKAIFTPGA
ncbi:arsenate reductase [Emticicia fluvialis]|uniref:arsenate reductase n=1 Tax=Emticicia fluvialis TaxID=2974474 RepID=UPI002165C4BA|nr:arsenate reductase [Emticicia fluvialis]